MSRSLFVGLLVCGLLGLCVAQPVLQQQYTGTVTLITGEGANINTLNGLMAINWQSTQAFVNASFSTATGASYQLTNIITGNAMYTIINNTYCQAVKGSGDFPVMTLPGSGVWTNTISGMAPAKKYTWSNATSYVVGIYDGASQLPISFMDYEASSSFTYIQYTNGQFSVEANQFNVPSICPEPTRLFDEVEMPSAAHGNMFYKMILVAIGKGL